VKEHSTAFAPVDIKDGRKEGEWASRYKWKAWVFIAIESIYLLAHVFGVPIALAFACSGAPRSWYGLTDAQYQMALPGVCAWLGGTLGGTLFDLKWLYHSVAKQIWNVDRILWRLFIPHLSGGLAFGTILLMSSGVIRLFDAQAMNAAGLTIGISFLIGYFSDMAVGKLTEVAKTLFGPTREPPTRNQAEHAMSVQEEEKSGTASTDKAAVDGAKHRR